jgi:MFS family permease
VEEESFSLTAPYYTSVLSSARRTSQHQPHHPQHHRLKREWCVSPFFSTHFPLVICFVSPVGISLSAPWWGRIVDSRGPRILLAAAFLLLLTGYGGTQYIFDAGLPPNASTISTFTIILLILCACMIGIGSSASITGAVNSTAKTFPDKAVRSSAPPPLPFFIIVF